MSTFDNVDVGVPALLKRPAESGGLLDGLLGRVGAFANNYLDLQGVDYLRQANLDNTIDYRLRQQQGGYQSRVLGFQSQRAGFFMYGGIALVLFLGFMFVSRK